MSVILEFIHPVGAGREGSGPVEFTGATGKAVGAATPLQETAASAGERQLPWAAGRSRGPWD